MIKHLIDQDFTDILGQDKVKKDLKSALFMKRHVIIVGPPGIGKTTLARNVAKLLPDTEVVDGCEFHCSPKNPICPECKAKKTIKKSKIKGEERFIRIQGSPDLTAEDLLGDIDPIKALNFGPLSMEAFTPGKIFKANNGILFFDEVNRSPEKLQNALLQVLQEGSATLGSYDVDIPANFIFIGTMNPEDFSTERLSDVFSDRFDFIYMGYPETLDIEKQIVKQKGNKVEVDFPEPLLELCITFVRELRDDENLEKKPSVRASLGLYERAQSNCLLDGRKKVTFKDIKDAVVSVLSHRIKLKPSIKYLEDPKDFIIKEFSQHASKHEDSLGGDG
ncbi:MAG: ATP-binding protein [Nanoarchaeota archaeon]|nr:ATP-binding protein [Nanoarchaeota archaeon]